MDEDFSLSHAGVGSLVVGVDDTKRAMMSPHVKRASAPNNTESLEVRPCSTMLVGDLRDTDADMVPGNIQDSREVA